MIHHSTILDDFFDDPNKVRDQLLKQELIDYKASDGVIYPGIIRLPFDIEQEIMKKVRFFFGADPLPEKTTMFARFSTEEMSPPHWAHSDYNMTHQIGICYLSPVDHDWDGTHLLRNKETNLEIHPETDEQAEIIKKQANDKDKWDIIYTCPSRFNRMLFLDGALLHAAAGQFGKSKEEARLVVTVFFSFA